jgi:hypothetical protein
VIINARTIGKNNTNSPLVVIVEPAAEAAGESTIAEIRNSRIADLGRAGYLSITDSPRHRDGVEAIRLISGLYFTAKVIESILSRSFSLLDE